MGTEGGDKCVDNVDKLRKKWWRKGTNPEEVCDTTEAATLCGRLGQALRSSTYVDFREGPLTLVNIVGVGD